MLYVASKALTVQCPVAAASITNLSPGLGDVSANYASLNSTAKVILSFAMLMGRLKIFTILVLFTPAFWRD